MENLAGLKHCHLHLWADGVPAHGKQNLLFLKVSCFLIKDSVDSPGEQGLDSLPNGIGCVAFQRSRPTGPMLAKLKSGCGSQTQNTTWLGNATTEVDLAVINQTPKP